MKKFKDLVRENEDFESDAARTLKEKPNKESMKKIKEDSDTPPITVRSLYTKMYAKHGGTVYKVKDAQSKAYAEVEKKHGKEMRNSLEAFHKKNMNEENDTTEKTEMASTQAHFIKYAAEEILEYIEMGGEIEEWYQNKLSKVHSDVESLHSWMEGEKRRTGMVKEGDEHYNDGAAKMQHHIGDEHLKDNARETRKYVLKQNPHKKGTQEHKDWKQGAEQEAEYHINNLEEEQMTENVFYNAGETANKKPVGKGTIVKNERTGIVGKAHSWSVVQGVPHLHVKSDNDSYHSPAKDWRVIDKKKEIDGPKNEEVEQIDEKNVPTSPEKWAQAKAQAKAKFDVYPSAYANGWAAKKYKAMGGGWKSVSEESELKEGYYKNQETDRQETERLSKKDDVPFKADKPTKKSVVIGKKPEGYSIARQLARQAMQKYMKKPVKEENTEKFYNTSRKTQIVKNASKNKNENKFEPDPVLSKMTDKKDQ